jgi:circadian clock protein KaiB
MMVKDTEREVGSNPNRYHSEWRLKLYVAGQTPRALAAFANLKRICEKHLAGRYRIELIDLLINPARARSDQIVAVPSLVRQLPEPAKKLVGDLASEERVVAGLEMFLPVVVGAGSAGK